MCADVTYLTQIIVTGMMKTAPVLVEGQPECMEVRHLTWVGLVGDTYVLSCMQICRCRCRLS